MQQSFPEQESAPRQRAPLSLSTFAWRTMIVIVLLGAAALVCYVAEIVLLIFGGILIGILLDFLADKVRELTHTSRGWALGIVVAALCVLTAIALWTALPRLTDQVNRLIHILPEGLERVSSYLQTKPWGQTLLDYLPRMVPNLDITGKLTTLVMKIGEGIAALVVILVVGLYLGAHPQYYEGGLLRLIPQQQRARARDVLGELAYTLRWWMIGQMVPMIVLGIASTIGLRLLHVDLAFTLGLFTGVMIFIPYIGALIAFAVTLLVTLVDGPATIIWVSVLFLGIHALEGYLLTPLVQKRTVYLSPGLSIIFQVVMGLLLGFLGLALATPLAAAILVLVKMLYLHERPERHAGRA